MTAINPQKFVISVLPQTFAVCWIDPTSAIPAWATKSSFFTISRTSEELSIICPQEDVPDNTRSDAGWRCFKVEGPLDLTLTGIFASLANALSNAKISIFALSTYDTDYLMVKQENVDRAASALTELGHQVRHLT